MMEKPILKLQRKAKYSHLRKHLKVRAADVYPIVLNTGTNIDMLPCHVYGNKQV